MTTKIEGDAPFKMGCVPGKRRRRSGSCGEEGLPEDVRDRLAELLPEEALEEAVRGLKTEELTGPGGLLTQLAGRVIEAALGAELEEHLGYPHGQKPPAENVRNGATSKTVSTDLGPVQLRTPRDRDSSFDPRLVKSAKPGSPGSMSGCLTCTRAVCRFAISPPTWSSSTACRSAATPSAASPTRCSRTSPPGGSDRSIRSTRSSISTP